MNYLTFKKTSTAKQVLGNCERMVLANFIGKAVNLYFVVLLYYAVKLLINLSYFSGCQPLYCTCWLVYWCTVHAKSFMNHAYVMFCPCPPPIFKMYVSEILYERVFILNYVIWNENEWRVTDILLAIDVSETHYNSFMRHSAEQNCHFIKLWNLK